MTSDLTIEFIHRIRPVVSQHTRRTPLVHSHSLSALAGCEVYLKCENLQLTGSFKLRGAIAEVAELDDDTRRRGVFAASAGNHGQGLALAAQRFGVPCTVVVPRSVPRVKEEAIRGHGAIVRKAPFDGYDDTQAWMHEHADEFDGTFVSAFEGVGVMAGNGGTLGLEIVEDVPELDAIVVPCGGGGCVVGVGAVVHAMHPATRVIAVNTDASPGMWLSRRDGRAHVHVDSAPTIAEGLEGGVGPEQFELGRQLIDDVVLVEEAAIRRAVVDVARLYPKDFHQSLSPLKKVFDMVRFASKRSCPRSGST